MFKCKQASERAIERATVSVTCLLLVAVIECAARCSPLARLRVEFVRATQQRRASLCCSCCRCACVLWPIDATAAAADGCGLPFALGPQASKRRRRVVDGARVVVSPSRSAPLVRERDANRIYRLPRNGPSNQPSGQRASSRFLWTFLASTSRSVCVLGTA